MNNVLFFVVLVVIGSAFTSWYITNFEHSFQSLWGAEPLGNDVKISLNNISTDKVVYHSSDVMNFSAVIYSNLNLENVTVMVKGINGRLNEKKILNVSEGTNEIFFTYELPRCNVCGGIRAGDYDLECELIYKNITIKDSIRINIQQ